MGEILTECLGSLEACWWGNGAETKPFSPKFVTLAEKLGFNVEKVSKISPQRFQRASSRIKPYLWPTTIFSSRIR